MNRKQRDKNRQTARGLRDQVRLIEDSKYICRECGKPGMHWLSTMWPSLENIMALHRGTLKQEDTGFWTCDKFYDPVTKRRIGT